MSRGARCLAGYFGPLLAGLFGHGPFSPLPQSFRTKIRTTSAILPRPAGEGEFYFWEDRWDIWDIWDLWDTDEA